MSFQVSSKIDSRTVLDQGGAEQLLGHGDMLYLPAGKPVPVRVHGAFVDDHEVHNVVNFRKIQGQPAMKRPFSMLRLQAMVIHKDRCLLMMKPIRCMTKPLLSSRKRAARPSLRCSGN